MGSTDTPPALHGSLMHADRVPEEATGISTAAVKYKNYDVDVRLRYGFQLVGWPVARVKFKKPSAIGAISDLTIIHGALLAKDLRWEKISAADMKELANTAKRPERATRSDAGTKKGTQSKRKRSVGGANKENELPVKKRLKSLGKQLPKSRATIEDSDHDDDDENGSDDEEVGEGGVSGTQGRNEGLEGDA